jgi:hypothetical protein
MLEEILEKPRSGDEGPGPLPKISSAVTDAVEDGVRSARRAIKSRPRDRRCIRMIKAL